MMAGLSIFTIVCFSVVIVGMSVASLFMAAATWNIKHWRSPAAMPAWVRFAHWLGRIR